MTIRSTFDGDFTAIKLSGMADDMLAQVVADHAADRFQPSNRANALAAGGFIPYSVAVDGRPMHQGQGEIFPQQQVALAVNPPGRTLPAIRTLPTIIIEWGWDNLQGSLLERALAALVRADKAIGKVEDPLKFARHLLEAVNSPGIALMRLLLTKYAKYRFPVLLQRLDEAKALYRVYRIVSGVAGAIGGKDQTADASVLTWIAGELRARSPVVSGEYRDAHTLYADGEELMNADVVRDDTTLPQAEEFSFTNTVPYSRKIEMGKTESGRDFVIQVEPHIYERVADAARQRFPDVTSILFEFRAEIAGAQTPQRRARKPHNAPAIRYPSIVVRF